MKITHIPPAKATHTLQERPNRAHITHFKTQLSTLFERVTSKHKESEEHQKNIVSDFLKNTFYAPHYEVNTKGKEDLVIHLGKTSKEEVGILFETKTPASREMMTLAKPNAKALQQLILYYLRERYDDNNLKVKHLVATDIFTWFIFDESLFHQHFYNDARLKTIFDQHKDPKKGTSFFFYEETAKRLEALDIDLPCIVFDLRDYQKHLADDAAQESDTQLIPLFKVFSPAFLLKLPVANDANSLDKHFYAELLHLIGLEEVKDGAKKVIRRKAKPDAFSLMENTIAKLHNKTLRRLPNVAKYGDTTAAQIENVALELCITWVNRVLFLKLLEAQLVKYNRNNTQFRFLTPTIIFDYNRLNNLFFEVLAIPHEQRTGKAKTEFAYVPYLNSSLFERTPDLEEILLEINQLDDGEHLPIFPQSVLNKNDVFKKQTKSLPTLEYLLRFLDAYDFSAEANHNIQEQAEDKKLINASVLGLIFEKINGYKDGSFFTPAFVTMYMCRESIRRAVLQKFQENGFRATNIPDLSDEIKDRKHANALVNDLKICDPAVGSGHFLVSALNEIIAIKSDLGILEYRDGRLVKGFEVKVIHDELHVFDEEAAQIFEYRLSEKGTAISEKQRMQEMLFHEKKSIIENSLFGVDINPNSVKICRLRLWIELLKNAFYTADSNFRYLETLPNIDINIKEGNSLISRFTLTDDLSDVFKRQGFAYMKYLKAVKDYKNTKSKDDKRDLEQFIQGIKTQFRAAFHARSKENKDLSRFKGELFTLQNQGNLFGGTIDTTEEARLTLLVAQQQQKVDDIQQNTLYRNAFEWRFEFPEVLNEQGDFVGFDVVIGNPPYINAKDLIEKYEMQRKYISSGEYTTLYQKWDIYIPFIELGIKITNHGICSMIIPYPYINQTYAKISREFIVRKNTLLEIIDLTGTKVFDEATVNNCIIFVKGQPNQNEYSIQVKKLQNSEITLIKLLSSSNILDENSIFQLETRFSLSLTNNFKKLEDLVFISIGMVLNADEKKAQGLFVKDDLINDKPSNIYCKKYVEAKNIDAFRIKSIRYLEWGTERVPNLIRRPTFTELYENPKILINKIGVIKATLDTDKLYCDQTIRIAVLWKDLSRVQNNSIQNSVARYSNFGRAELEKFSENINLKYLVGILNSKLCNYLINSIRGVANIDINPEYLKNIYIPYISESEQQPIITLVERILTQKQTHPSTSTAALEAEIDRLVYGLYGLTEEEIGVIESAV